VHGAEQMRIKRDTRRANVERESRVTRAIIDVTIDRRVAHAVIAADIFDIDIPTVETRCAGDVV